jgi:hypothetical protein
MADSGNQNMVLVYDLRRDHRQREQILSQVPEQWPVYKRGEWPVQVFEGRISKVSFNAYDAQHLFELDEGMRKTTWVRQGDDSWYVVGWRAKVEQVVFQAPPPIGAVPVVTRIWIGSSA